MKVSPVARTESLIVKEVDGETLVYDLKTDKAHCLNDTASRVWKYCDGRKSVSEIAQLLSAESNASVSDEVVWLALDELKRFKLLDQVTAKPAHLSGITRRQAVRALGMAAIVLPMVTSLVVPTAMAQGSLLPNGACCHSPGDCQSHCCDTIPSGICDCTVPTSDPCGPPNKACKPLDFVAGNPTCKPA